jgi:predicted KAP-like P-loop ATPase
VTAAQLSEGWTTLKKSSESKSKVGQDRTSQSDATKTIPLARNDNPIRRPEDDVLGRMTAARSFALQVLSLDANEGLVVGVLGPWGSGKTSFVNLARPHFENAGVVLLEFNPWMFSGAQQLVESFFTELAAQLSVRPGLSELGKDFGEYGELFSSAAWLPFVGAMLARAGAVMKILGTLSQQRKEGIGARRTKIEHSLAKLEKPIVIVLDDIDRLPTPEIRDIFKLIRLTASFPNLIYVAAFDRKRVEQALEDDNVPGRAYLEKILQVAVDLPAIPQLVLTKQIASALDAVISEIENPGDFHEGTWPDVFVEIILPLIRNMRDVRRYAMAMKGTLVALEGQIALVDVLALEAIRVFLPDVFAKLHTDQEALTVTVGDTKDSAGMKKKIDSLVEMNKEHADVVRAMIRRLFPASQRHLGGSQYPPTWLHSWLKKRRVAHVDVLRLYLERVAGEGLQSFVAAEQAWSEFADREALEKKLRLVDAEMLQDVIASLESYEDEFKPPHVVPAVITLLNLLPDLPQRARGMFDLDARFTVGRVTLRLLRCLNGPAAVEAAIRQILPELASLSSKFDLILQIGYQPNAGFKLVREEAATEFERNWRGEVRSASVSQLALEKQLLSVLIYAKRESLEGESALVINDSPEMTTALLRAAQNEVKSQGFGTRAVRRTAYLNWDALLELYGDDATLFKRIRDLKATGPEGIDDLLDLAEKYQGGWRPSRNDYYSS